MLNSFQRCLMYPILGIPYYAAVFKFTSHESNKQEFEGIYVSKGLGYPRDETQGFTSFTNNVIYMWDECQFSIEDNTQVTNIIKV